MNEEEKDSVKILNNTELDVNTIYSVDLYTYNYAVKTVLNLIEKQQAEIEKLKNNNKDLLRKLRNRVKDVKKLEKYNLYKNEFATLNKRIEKKDMIINLMAEQLTTPVHSKEWVIDYYKKEIDNDRSRGICKN